MNDDDRKIIEQLWSFSRDRRESIFKEFSNQAFTLHADQFIDFTRNGYPSKCFWEQKIELKLLGRPSFTAEDSLSSISSSSNDMFTPPVSPLHDDITNSPFPNFDETDQASIASSLARSKKNLLLQDELKNHRERSHQESSQSFPEDVDQVSGDGSGDDVCEEIAQSDNCRSEAWDQIESLLKKNEVLDPFGVLEVGEKSPQTIETSPENSSPNQEALSKTVEEPETIHEGSIPLLASIPEVSEEAPSKEPEHSKEHSSTHGSDSQKADECTLSQISKEPDNSKEHLSMHGTNSQKAGDCTLSQISEQSLPDVDEPYAFRQQEVPTEKIEEHITNNELDDDSTQVETWETEAAIEPIPNSTDGVENSETNESQPLKINKKSQHSSKSKKSENSASKKVKNSSTTEELLSRHPVRASSQRGEVPCENLESRATSKLPRKKSNHHENVDEDDDDCDISLWDAFDDIETYEGFSQSRKRTRKDVPAGHSRKKRTFEEKFFKRYPDAECQIFKHEVKVHVLRSQQWMLKSNDPASNIDDTYTVMHNNMFKDVVAESALHAHCESYAFNSLPPIDEDDDIMEIPTMIHSNVNVNRNRILSDSESDGSDRMVNPEDAQPSTSTRKRRTKRIRMSTSNPAKKPRRVSDDDSNDATDDDPWDLPQYLGADDDEIEEVEEVRETKEKNANSEPRYRRKSSVDGESKKDPSLNYMKRYSSKHSIRERQLRRISAINYRIRGSTDDELAVNLDNQTSENIPPGSNMPLCLPISATSPRKGGRKNIRDLKTDAEITKASRVANEREKKRLIRVVKINKMLEKCPAVQDKKRLILDIDHKTNEPRVEVHPDLVKHLKDHQFKGIQFMYTNTIENVDLLKEDNEGTGCILAHCMGLGKTLQVIAYVHTILTHPLLKNEFRKIMIAAPVNTLKNWYDEFRKWLPIPDALNIYQMADLRDSLRRANMLGKWYDKGGVLIIGLPSFTSLSNLKFKTTNTPSAFKNIDVAFINPGPDILIIDEGHLLKNDKTKVFQAFCQVPTERKIVLTGTPLQNNLEEYYTMIDLIKPRLLGTKKEFANRFKNPIENGQHADSTAIDILTMKRRCTVLDRILTGSVQRFDYEVLKPYLKPKYEYSIFVQATDLMIELYNYYLDNVTNRRNQTLLADSILLRLVCNHPAILPIRSEKEAKFAAARAERNKQKNGRIKNSLIQEFDLSEEPDEDQIIVIRKDLVGESDQSTPNIVNGSDGSGQPVSEPSDDSPAEWFRKFMKDGESFRKVELSAKFIVFFFILEQCVIKNEKLVVISQCLETLDLIEEFLASHKKVQGSPTLAQEIEWVKDRTYFRIDGTVQPEKRKLYIDCFNNPSNQEAKMFLLAVKAGGLGVNLIGANRAIIFDTHWNPMVDMQAIFRIYRLGQTKPSFIYRLITKDTLEEKIYLKQILKTGLSMRVVDKTNIQNSVRKADVEEYYSIRPQKRCESSQLPSIPKDDLLGDLILAHRDCIVEYREQDSLLQKKPEEDLDEQQRQQAWEDYEKERDEEKRRSEKEAQDARKMSELEKRLIEDELRAKQSEVQPTSSVTDSAEESTMINAQPPSVSTSTATPTSNVPGCSIESLHLNGYYDTRVWYKQESNA
ncbi:uncharacterized protein LOC141856839 isoform X2 [Brevipalpus obovatus]|uniref:uncharacterized protein LOC141856839 isoform X2 n=1 Tax=Brevipalpus obovatus TaxID=246614 RepID=UPI003D9EC261